MSHYCEHQLSQILQWTKVSSRMDNIGLFTVDNDGRYSQGKVVGLPRGFTQAYAALGIQVDPVLAEVREHQLPVSTLTHLGSRWRDCELYNRVSRHFGLTGFATFPLFDRERLNAVLYFGAETDQNAKRLDHHGMLRLSSHAMKVAARLADMPSYSGKLTERQNDVARLAGDGLSNREIARALGTGEAAVRKHLKSLNRHFGTHNRTAMAAAYKRSL
ncbi:MAG: LuxR C-terminal-related transcriptional regulator [Pseudomonadota bacterium]